jgi:rubrerythrin
VDEGITAEQLAATDRWRKQIHGVAMEEMLHLALVSKLLMSIGSPPHSRRDTFRCCGASTRPRTTD